MTKYVPQVDIPQGMPWQDVFAYVMEQLKPRAETSKQLELPLEESDQQQIALDLESLEDELYAAGHSTT